MTGALLSAALVLLSPPAPGADTVRLTLYKLQQPVGTEQWVRAPAPEGEALETHWRISYLGSDAEMRARLLRDPGGAPRALAVAGATSTMTSTDVEVEMEGGGARVRDRAGERRVTAAEGAFPLAHYPPYALVEALYAHWARTGRPDSVPLLPEGAARFQRRGRDTLPAAAGGAAVERFSVDGVGWGRMTAWLDDEGRLIGAAHGDAELDRMEALRSGREAALPLLVARSVADGIADLEALARAHPPRMEGDYAITGVRIVDGTGAAPVEDGTIVLRDGRIAAIGPAERVAVPKGLARFDAGGATALPGLWDMHVHYEQVEWPLVSLASGVTTVRDAANELELIVALREASRAGRILSPRILAAGVIDGGPHPLGVVTADSEEEARAGVRRYAELGFEQVKIYAFLDTSLVAVVVEEAARHGMTVTGHVPRGMDALAFVRAGAHQINHVGFVGAVLRVAGEVGQPPRALELDSPEAREVLASFAERGTVVDPSLARMEVHRHPRGAFAEREPGVLLVPRELREALHSTGAPPELQERAHAAQVRSLAIVGALHRAGVPVVLGSDLGVPGFAIYRELELAVEAGLTPMEAIQAATLVPARAMGLEGESGTLEAGKRADVVLVDGDPLADVSRIRRVRWVVSGGRLYDSAELWNAAGFDAPR